MNWKLIVFTLTALSACGFEGRISGNRRDRSRRHRLHMVAGEIPAMTCNETIGMCTPHDLYNPEDDGERGDFEVIPCTTDLDCVEKNGDDECSGQYGLYDF